MVSAQITLSGSASLKGNKATTCGAVGINSKNVDVVIKDQAQVVSTRSQAMIGPVVGLDSDGRTRHDPCATVSIILHSACSCGVRLVM